MGKANEVAVREEGAMVEQAVLDMFNMKENMEGVQPEFPAIKIIHQGQMFEMPSGKKVETFTGIVVDIARTNAWWEEDFDTSGGGTPPDCFSMDGIVPSHDSENMQHDDCATCPQNKFGSAGRGKACKNMKRLFILMDGERLPFRLTVPPTNIKPVDRFITQMSSKGIPYQLSITDFSLEKAKNKDGIEYSALVLSSNSVISDIDRATSIKQLITDLKSAMRGTVINSSEV